MNSKSVLWFLCVFTTGCDQLLDKDFLYGLLPSVEFSGLNVGYVDFEQVQTDFVFSVHNPNPIGFSVHDFDYSLSFSGVQWASGEDPNGLILNPSNTSELSLPVDIVFSDLYEMIQASRGADSLPFGVEGNFGFLLDESSIILDSAQSNVSEAESGEYVLNIPYDAGGNFPALRKPDFHFQKLEVRELNFTGVSFDLVIDVDNEHASNLIFTRFDYAFVLGSSSLIQGVVDNLDEIIHGVAEGNQNRELRIPIEVDTIQAVTSLLGILSGSQQLNFGFTATTDVDTPFGLVELSIDERGNISIQ